MKTILKILLVAVVVVVAAILTTAGIAYNLNKVPANKAVGEYVFTVIKGESVHSIATRLENEELIRSELFMRLISRIKGTETSFQAGSYSIGADATSIAVHEVLVSGKEILKKVTIPEGLSLSRVAEILQNEGIVSRENFLAACGDLALMEKLGIPGDSAEGFLFPDTYLLPGDYPAEKVVVRMAQRFFEILEEIDSEYRRLSTDDLRDKVIMASIIEREYVVPEDARLMASVFYNRLEIGMKLQSCATVAYALSEEYGREYPDRLTLRDLEVTSSYNTYLHEGIPPSPISNPGKTAIAAVFDPAITDYLFFLLKDQESGSHEFTINYQDHLVAKNLFLKKN
jgi:UPF0755 protein